VPKGNATKLAYKLHVNADGSFQEQGVQLTRSEVVLEAASNVIEVLETAIKTGTTRDAFLDAHNQRSIAAIREHFANRPAVPPEPAPQPSESDA